MRTAANTAFHSSSSHAKDTENRIADNQNASPSLKSWVDENIKEPNQRIYDVWHGPNDYVVRVIVDTAVVALQPANITLKATIGEIGASKASLKALNFTARHESSSVKVSTGTKLQFGYDVTKSDRSKRADYIKNNEPVMDLISIEALGEGAIDRLRTEFKLGIGSKTSSSLVMQEALSLGGNIRWRRVWENSKTGEKSGIDVMLTMKAEASMNVGVGKENGTEGKAELEVGVRFFGAIANTVDIHHLEDLASKAVAKMYFQSEANNKYVLNTKSRQPKNMSVAQAQIIKQGWVGCEKTQKQLIMGWDGKTGQTVMMDDAGTVLGRYDQGTTKAQIADTMANPNSQLYMKGSDLHTSINTGPVSLSTVPSNKSESSMTPGLSAAIDPITKRVKILNNNQLVAELKSGATLENARELIAIGTFNTKDIQAVKSITALESTTPSYALVEPRLRMA